MVVDAFTVLLLIAAGWNSCEPPSRSLEPTLLERLQSDNVNTRLSALVERWPSNIHKFRSTAPTLVKLLEDDDARVRREAAATLGDLGAYSEVIVNSLSTRIKDREPEVRVAAALALWRVTHCRGELQTVVEPLLASKSSQVRLNAAQAWWELGGASDRVVHVLIELLEDEDDWIRMSAAERLGEIGPEARHAAVALARRLRVDDDNGVLSAVGDALQRIGPEAKAAIPILSTLLSETRGVRWFGHAGTNVGEEAAIALVHMGEAGIAAVLKALATDDQNVRLAALAGLSWNSPHSDRVVPAVSRLVTSENRQIRHLAIAILADYANQSDVALVIAKCLRHPDEFTRAYSAQLLGKIGRRAKSAASALVAALADEDAQVRYRAASALGAINPRADLAVPALIECLDDNEAQVYTRWGIDSVSCNAMYALGAFGVDAKEAIPKLVHCVQSPVRNEQHAAIATLAAIGPAAEPAVPALWKVVDKLPTCKALERISPKDPRVLKAALTQLHHEFENHRLDAVVALVAMAPRLESARAALRRVLDDTYLDVRVYAAIALLKASPDDHAALRVFVASLAETEEDFDAWSNPKETADTLATLKRVGRRIRPLASHLLKNIQSDGRLSKEELRVLNVFGPHLREALPLLFDTAQRRWSLVSQYDDEREPIVGAIVGVAGESIQELIAALSDERLPVRIIAANALSRMGAKAKRAVPQLTALLQDRRQATRSAAAKALGRVGAFDKNAAEALSLLLTDDYLRVRRASACALGEFGPPAKFALPLLRRVASRNDEFETVRLAAEKAIVSIIRDASHNSD